MSTHRHLLTFAGCLLCAAALHAGDTAPDKAEPVLEPYQLKNRSSFSCASEDARAPFWPIGWVHRKGTSSVAASLVTAKTVLDEKSFRVTSILLGSGATPSLAVINGRAYSEGEFLKMPRATAAPAVAGTPAVPAGARIRVQRISDGTVILQREEQTLTIALLRQELAQKKTEEPLLDDER